MTLLELRTQARQRADMENSRFVSDDELNTYINQAYAELYDLLVSRFEDYFLSLDTTTGSAPTYTLTGGVSGNYITLPNNFYKLRGIDSQLASGQWQSLRKFNFAERNRISLRNRSSSGYPVQQYRRIGARIYILAPEQSAGTYQLWYIPRIVKLALDEDQLSDVMDYEEFVVVGAAKRCLIKEESDTSTLDAQLKIIMSRITSMASNSDAGENDRVSDVSGDYDF